jgi:1-acyl-sn-glycerol-3-phosphate acyltransferase/DNA-directed RNA polymerase subunit RPC12/RpoP
MKKDLKTKLINRKIKKPNPLLMSIAMWVLGILNRLYKVKFSYDYAPKSLKGKPTILIASHAARLEFIYMMYGFKRKDINIVCGYQNIIKKGIYRVLLSLGVISKYLYQPDIVCVKQMFKVLKRNGAIGLFPEGIQSTSGSTHPINPATAQFIKRSKANIVVATSKGAYLATNRYSSDRKKGPIHVSYSLLFTPEMLETISEKEIYDLILQKISYNDFEFNKVARHKYVGKKPNAFGIDKILYKCPDCKEEYTLHVEHDTIKCTHCGFSVRVNEYYDLVDFKGNARPTDIDEWYKWQRRCVVKEVQDENFEMTLSGSLCALKLDKLRKAPKDRTVLSVGQVRLTKSGLSFKGTIDGQNADFEFNAKYVYSLTFSTQGFLEFYHNNDYYMIVPDDRKQCLIKWTLAAEEIHNLYDEKWKLACADVYEYNKGDTNE